MLRVPVDDIISKIVNEKEISAEDVEAKIKTKLDQLSGLVSREGAAHIVAHELGVKIFEKISGKMAVKDLQAGLRDIELLGKVSAIYEVRSFERKDGIGQVGSFVLADPSGQTRIVCWNAMVEHMKSLEVGDVVKVISGYVKENNNRLEIHMNDRSRIVRNPPGEDPGDVKMGAPQSNSSRSSIKDLSEDQANVELLGTIVQIFDPRFFEVCPTCNKRARKEGEAFRCEVHGEVAIDYSYVLNVVLDDGTDNIRCVFFRNQAERLLSKSHEEMIAFKDAPGSFEDLKQDLLGEMVKIIGRVQRNSMFDRLEFVSQMVITNPDPQEEIDRLKSEQQS